MYSFNTNIPAIKLNGKIFTDLDVNVKYNINEFNSISIDDVEYLLISDEGDYIRRTSLHDRELIKYIKNHDTILDELNFNLTQYDYNNVEYCEGLPL